MTRGRRAQPAPWVMVGLLAVSLASCRVGSPASAGPTDCAAYERYGHLEGRTVSIYSGYIAPMDKTFMDSLRTFGRCTGVRIIATSDQYVVTDAVGRVTGVTNPPDLVIVGQPGLLRQLVSTKRAKPAPAPVVANLSRFWSSDWRAYVTADGTASGPVYGAPIDASVKSLVWYSPKEFANNHYDIPTTLDQLVTLSNTIAAAGKTVGRKPWCEGVKQDYATGWPITDWMEDMMLRLAAPPQYDQWVSHQIAFDSTWPTRALAEVGVFLNPEYVNGYPSVALDTTSEDGGLAILHGKCSMRHAPSFAEDNWPPGTRVAPDGDVFVFYLPPARPGSQPVLVGGDFVLAFSGRPEVQAMQAFLSSDTWANDMAAASHGHFASANKGLAAGRLDPVNAYAVKLLQDTRSVVRFDASDQMPPSIGLDVLFKQLVLWMKGQTTATTLRNVEAAWPRS